MFSGLGPDIRSVQALEITGLGRVLHLTIRSGNHNHCSIHVCSSRNHVLDVIRVSWTVDVGVMSVLGLVFDVGGGDCDATLPLLGRFVDGPVVEEVCKSFFGLPLGDCSCECCLRSLSLD